MSEGTSETFSSTFPGWLRPPPEPSIFFEDALVALDASAILALYRVNKDARAEVLQLLSTLGDRLWIPHQAALEFARSRMAAVQGRLDDLTRARRSIGIATRDAVKILEGAVRDVQTFRRQCHASREWDPKVQHLDHESLDGRLTDVMNPALQELSLLQDEYDLKPSATQEQDLLTEIDKLLSGRIGTASPPGILQQLVREAIEFRYPNQIPPGYLDIEKKTDLLAAGDYILWSQVIKQARTLDEPRRVLLVINDVKADWWVTKPRSFERRPRPELIQELWESAGAELHLITLADLAADITKSGPTKLPDATLQELRQSTQPADIDPERVRPGGVDLLQIPPIEFENIIHDLLLRMGYEIVEMATLSDPRLGYDFLVHYTGDDPYRRRTAVVEAKRTRSPLGISTIRQLHSAMIAHGTDGGILFTTSGITYEARGQAIRLSISIVDGPHLAKLIEHHLGITVSTDR